MKIFTAAIATETNTFSPIPTGLDCFHARGYFPAGQHPDQMMHFAGPTWATRLRAKGTDWQVVEGTAAGAMPAGLTTRHAYETLRDEILADLKKAGKVDIVLLGLHGAMVADGYDDCEGDILSRVRAIVGKEVVIGAELDPHCHFTPLMADSADLLICFKEYPHTDILDRGLDLVDRCVAMQQGKIKPSVAVFDCEMASMMHTSREPMRSFVDRLFELEKQPGIISISIAQSFPWGDVPEMGTKVIVYTDDNPAKAAALAQQLGREIIEFRDLLQAPYPSVSAAIDQALAGPVFPAILADSADNPGGGAAGDSTFILEELLKRHVKDVVLGPLWDPVAIQICQDAGMGARLPLRIGGKTSPASGNPVDVMCMVKELKKEAIMTGLSGSPSRLGNVAVIEVEGITIVLVTARNQAIGTDLFTQFGIDLARQKLIVVKSSQHFQAEFSKVSGNIIYVDSPGSVPRDLAILKYKKVRFPKWPVRRQEH
ncbi:M81 family metallopeptidase [Paralcaligenes sp. KSB-10]|uniref:M81 family metallopeptidase n=1 Tax=Paralcaligenes sp. KSB-10 TaxID=2901142 RepID=UPI001E4F8672|nr:M81 family metallopeptidase [Paralcaligenes sp. KSB-10]UHL64092.1 M81 family metallopeptidase [Paralcaligenes sp. KSB-10]